jgi:hypothetical protein
VQQFVQQFDLPISARLVFALHSLAVHNCTSLLEARVDLLPPSRSSGV